MPKYIPPQDSEYQNRLDEEKERNQLAHYRDLEGSDQLQSDLSASKDRALGMQPSTASAAQIDQQQQQQFRDAQTGLLAQLQDQAAGRAVNPAIGIQAQQMADEGHRRALGLALSTPGMSPAAAASAAQQAQAQSGIAAMQQATSLQAQQQQQAQQQIADLTGQARQQDIGVATGQAELEQQTELANQQKELEYNQLREQVIQNAIDQGLDIATAQMQADQQVESIRAKDAMAQKQRDFEAWQAQLQREAEERKAREAGGFSLGGGFLGAVGSVVSGIAASDRRLKTNIESSDGDLDDFMDALKAYSYEYKDDKYGKGRRISPMAQDLERSDIGRNFVEDTPEGKMVDYGKSLGTMMAAVARLNERLRKVETE